MNGKYCPIRQQYCDGNMCSLWDDDKDRCCFVSLAESANRMHDIDRELYEIRRQLEDIR